MSEADTRVITSHIPAMLAEQVDKLAERLDRSKGWVVKQALSEYLALEEQRHQMTLEALADVDAGRVISHQDMDVWLDDLLTNSAR